MSGGRPRKGTQLLYLRCTSAASNVCCTNTVLCTSIFRKRDLALICWVPLTPDRWPPMPVHTFERHAAGARLNDILQAHTLARDDGGITWAACSDSLMKCIGVL